MNVKTPHVSLCSEVQKRKHISMWAPVCVTSVSFLNGLGVSRAREAPNKCLLKKNRPQLWCKTLRVIKTGSAFHLWIITSVGRRTSCLHLSGCVCSAPCTPCDALFFFFVFVFVVPPLPPLTVVKHCRTAIKLFAHSCKPLSCASRHRSQASMGFPSFFFFYLLVAS